MVTNYEGDRPGAPTIVTRGLVSPAFLRREIVDLCAWAWDDFLDANGDPALNRLADVDGSPIFPHPQGALPDRYTGFDDDIASYPAYVRDHPIESFLDIPHLEEGVRGLEETRRVDLEEWMDALGLDAVVFPAVADVGPADMDVNESSAESRLAQRRLGGQRELGDPPPRHPHGDRADGHDGRHRHAGRAHVRRPRLRRRRAAAPGGRIRGDGRAEDDAVTHATS